MSQRLLVVAIFAAASILCGVALALGLLTLDSDAARWLILLPFALAWVMWEPLMRARAYEGTPPRPPKMAKRAALAVSILIGLGIILAIGLGWLNL